VPVHLQRSTMLKTLHHHIYATKLRSLVHNSPLVLVYQQLENFSSPQLQTQLEKQLEGKGADGFNAHAMRIRNCVADGYDKSFGAFFQSCNIILGWSQAEGAAKPLDATAARKDDITQLCGKDSDRESHIPHIPHQSLKTIVNNSVKVADNLPLVLVGCFYRGQQMKITQLKDWAALNPAQVYGELLHVLEASAEDICSITGPAEDLVGAVDSITGQELLDVLDHMAGPAAGQAAEAASA
jgi:hypothetical protein